MQKRLIALRRCCMQVLSIENVLPALQALPTVAHVELAVAALFDVSQVRMDTSVRHPGMRDSAGSPDSPVLPALHHLLAR